MFFLIVGTIIILAFILGIIWGMFASTRLVAGGVALTVLGITMVIVGDLLLSFGLMSPRNLRFTLTESGLTTTMIEGPIVVRPVSRHRRTLLFQIPAPSLDIREIWTWTELNLLVSPAWRINTLDPSSVSIVLNHRYTELKRLTIPISVGTDIVEHAKKGGARLRIAKGSPLS